MGIWPEFHKCCGIFPLNIGTALIGSFTLLVNCGWATLYTLLLVTKIQYHVTLTSSATSTATQDVSVVSYLALCLYLVIAVLQAALGLVILIGRKKAACLKKIVFFIAIVCLLNLLAVIMSISTEIAYEIYHRVLDLVLSAYFILLIRSSRLQLEGRLGAHRAAGSSRHLTSIYDDIAAHQRHHASPPNYEEAMRYGAVYRCTYSLTLPPTIEVANENISPLSEMQQTGVSLEEYAAANLSHSSEMNQRLSAGEEEASKMYKTGLSTDEYAAANGSHSSEMHKSMSAGEE